MTSWKTTAAGAAAILAAIAAGLSQFASGTLDASHLGMDMTGIITGIGLLFAKDSQVTGGSIKQ